MEYNPSRRFRALDTLVGSLLLLSEGIVGFWLIDQRRMPAHIKSRLQHWKEIFWGKAVAVIASVYFLVGLWSVLRTEFLPNKYQSLTIVKLTPQWSWRTWVIGFLVLIILILLEGAHAAIKKRDKALADTLNQKPSEPDFSYTPIISPSSYGRRSPGSFGLFICNDSYTAYDVSAESVPIGSTGAVLTFQGKLARFSDKDGKQFLEAWIVHSDGKPTLSGEHLWNVMLDADVMSLDIQITYKDGKLNWLQSTCRIGLEALSLGVSLVGQQRLWSPPKPLS